MTLNARSLERLKGVHPHLCKVIQAAADAVTEFTFQVSEGLRTRERQRELVAAGKSQTQNSRHLTGHAVDLVILNPDGSANWNFRQYAALDVLVQSVAMPLGIPVEWGGNWKSLRDGPHWQLPHVLYK